MVKGNAAAAAAVASGPGIYSAVYSGVSLDIFLLAFKSLVVIGSSCLLLHRLDDVSGASDVLDAAGYEADQPHPTRFSGHLLIVATISRYRYTNFSLAVI